MGEKIKNILTGQLMISVIYILLGVSLAFAPVGMVNIICKFVFGILLIAAGLYHVVIYAWEKMNATMLDLFSGAILLVLGVFLFRNPSIVIKLLPVLLGALILMDCIWSLKGCFKLKKYENGSWKFLLLATVIFIGLGITLIINPFSVVKTVIIFAGCVFLANGVFDIVFMILIKSGAKKNEKEKTEAEQKDKGNESLAQAEVNEENEVPELEKETYEPWNGATAVSGKTEKTEFWKKFKKTKKVSEETSEESSVAEMPVEETAPEMPEEDVSEEENAENTI